tara:strand:- start:135 stop:632 length:498 start_codon:yes stop_codon:yes gene_type:complete
MLLHKVCSSPPQNLNTEHNISPLKPLVLENLRMIPNEKVISTFEIQPPNIELYQLLIDNSMLDNSRFLIINAQGKTFKYKDINSNSLNLITLNDLLGLILNIIYEFCFPIIDFENKKLIPNYSSYNYDAKTNICTKENNRTENLINLKNEKTVLKLTKYFSAFFK